jgi:hypothetical protein
MFLIERNHQQKSGDKRCFGDCTGDGIGDKTPLKSKKAVRMERLQVIDRQ